MFVFMFMLVLLFVFLLLLNLKSVEGRLLADDNNLLTKFYELLIAT